MVQNLLRAIPKVDALLEQVQSMAEFAAVPRIHLVEAIRSALDNMRSKILDGSLGALPEQRAVIKEIQRRLESEMVFSLRPVINATGVVLHTNLGRAVLAREAAARVAEVASSYSTLEYDPASGKRGSRHKHVESILSRLTGAEAALVVNNNAAAVLLILSALFKGRELIVSRGELVEIGGSFRVPDIMAQSGVNLREVGTTNRTRLSDYAAAIKEGKTGGLMKVHTSNYRIIGFTEQASTAELAALAHEHGLPLISDLGSGSFINLQPLGIHDEPSVKQMLAGGVDLLCFSGDKLMGGAQAGFIIGRQELVEKLKKHPLARALRVDKLTLTALETTLRLYLNPDEAKNSIPTLAMLFAEPEQLKLKAEKLLEALKGLRPFDFECLPTESQAGGGSAPERPLPSWGVAVSSASLSPGQLEEGLRHYQRPIIARIAHDRLLFDVRTMDENDFPLVSQALAALSLDEH